MDGADGAPTVCAPGRVALLTVVHPLFTVVHPLPLCVLQVAYTAVFDKEGGGGDAARATGRAAVAGVAKARAVDAEYDLSTRAGDAAQAAGAGAASAWEQARAYDEQHRVRERVGTAAQAGLAKAHELDAEYRLGERAGAAARVVGQAAGQGLDAVLGWLNKPPAAAPAAALK